MGRKIDPPEDVGSAMLGLVAESGTVMTRRIAQMLTGRMSASEALRMGAEKQFAFAEAWTRAGWGTLRGDFPHAIWADAMMPYRRAVSANAERLGDTAEMLPEQTSPRNCGFSLLPDRFTRR